ncbi:MULTISPECIES: hypothetical protein [unclassified Luteococcus]|uniref:hypothetical protein n=1 Tax=unclassified Luteococcus TaxID=2639923 RepID=UPI00313E23AF
MRGSALHTNISLFIVALTGAALVAITSTQAPVWAALLGLPVLVGTMLEFSARRNPVRTATIVELPVAEPARQETAELFDLAAFRAARGLVATAKDDELPTDQVAEVVRVDFRRTESRPLRAHA